jgi:hypothetical protein
MNVSVATSMRRSSRPEGIDFENFVIIDQDPMPQIELIFDADCPNVLGACEHLLRALAFSSTFKSASERNSRTGRSK